MLVKLQINSSGITTSFQTEIAPETVALFPVPLSEKSLTDSTPEDLLEAILQPTLKEVTPRLLEVHHIVLGNLEKTQLKPLTTNNKS